jgi:dodecin
VTFPVKFDYRGNQRAPDEAAAPLGGRRPSASAGASIKEDQMAESVYKVIELVGTSTDSWEKAAKAAVERAAETLRDLRVAEVVEQDMQLQNGKVELYRAKVKVSFKYEKEAD